MKERPMKPKAFNPRGVAPQTSAWGDTYNPAGQCAKCARTVYSVTEPDNAAVAACVANGGGADGKCSNPADHTRENEPDPRGFAGPRHSLATLEEYPGVPFCWDCLNEHGLDGWKACELIAAYALESIGELAGSDLAEVRLALRPGVRGTSAAQRLLLDPSVVRIVAYRVRS